MEKVEDNTTQNLEDNNQEMNLDEIEDCEIIEEANDDSVGTIGDKMELIGEITLSNLNDENAVALSSRIKKTFDKNEDAILTLIKHDNKLLYGGMDDKLTVVDLEEGNVVHSQKFEETVTYIRINHDRTLIAVGTLDNFIRVISLEDYKEMSKFETDGEEITAMNFHSKGDVLLTGFKDGSIKMYKIPSGKEIITFFGHLDEVTEAQFSKNGKTVISSSMDSTLRTWSPKSGIEKARLEGHKFHAEGVICFTQHPDSKQKIVISGGVDCTVCMSSYDSGKIHQRTLPLSAPINAISICEQWKVFLASTLEGELITYDLAGCEEIAKTKEEEGIIGLLFDEKLKYFIATTTDGHIVLHGYGKSGIIKKYRIHEAEIHQFFVENGMMYSCGEDGRVCVTELPEL